MSKNRNVSIVVLEEILPQNAFSAFLEKTTASCMTFPHYLIGIMSTDWLGR